MELTKELRQILDLGIALTSEKEYSLLLEKILVESMNITNSDAGTIYIQEDEGLRFMIMQNKTMNTYQGGKGEKIDLPPVPLVEENICAYSAIHKKVVNIKDVYNCEEFDFKGPRNYDKITGYRTKSMLVIPLENHEGENIGVIQLINALDTNNNVMSYEEKYEYIVFSLASQAAVTLANMKHMEDMKKLLYSIVSAFTAAVDERTPYNANHTKNVALYTEEFIEYVNDNKEIELTFNEGEKEELVMAALLHDVGKLVTPLEVMNKSTRLDQRIDTINDRLSLISAYRKIDYLENNLTKEEYEQEENDIKIVRTIIEEYNLAPFIDDEKMAKIDWMETKKYIDNSGKIYNYITKEESENLRIRKGTLTDKERGIIENHVVMTTKILKNIPFGKKYSEVQKLAGEHHEYLNGTGYPNKLNEDTISYGSRILAIADIFDALVSTDRPYKKPMPIEKAKMILGEMVTEGKLDEFLVRWWGEYIDQRRGINE